MAYISPSGQRVIPYPILGQTTAQNTPQGTQEKTLPAALTGNIINLSGTPFTDWHKALLWFLGGVALVALANPAPGIATMILLIIIVGVLLGNWNDYKMFLLMK